MPSTLNKKTKKKRKIIHAFEKKKKEKKRKENNSLFGIKISRAFHKLSFSYNSDKCQSTFYSISEFLKSKPNI